MDLVPRRYQLEIYNSILRNGNTLVVLPTGLGKTLIALMLINDYVKKGKCLFLSPTKPLCKQHANSVKSILKTEDLALVSGEVSVQKRKIEYERPIIISTPQTIRNDIENRLFDPKSVALCIFDEAHRSVGDYAYTQVSEALKENALLVGLTASPGGRNDRIKEVLTTLNIGNVEIRTYEDEDVKEYAHDIDVEWVSVSLSPTLRLIKLELDQMIKEYSQLLGSLGFPPPLKSKGEFMKMRERIMNIPHQIKYTAIVYYSMLMNLMHMSELLETQGVHALRSYTEKLKTKETKSAAALMRRKEYARMLQLLQTEEEHPKLKLLTDILQRDFHGKKAIVFAQYRDQIAKINDELNKHGHRAKIFVGKKDGVTRKMQEETIAEFREGKFDFLVASSIGEEGLDIPAVDAVIFYEPIPSEIRSIQRRGRTGRFGKGKVLILMTKDTRDEYYFWASRRREKNMKRILYSMAGKKKPDNDFISASELKAGTKEDVAIRHETRPSSGQSKISDF